MTAAPIRSTPIVMVTNAVAPDQLGGLERYVRELSAALVRRGHPVSVVAKRVSIDHPPEEVAADGVRIIRHAVPAKSDPAFAVKYPLAVGTAVDRALPTIGRDAVLHAHFVTSALAPMLRRQPYLYTFHAPVHRELLDERQGSYLLPRPLQPLAVRGLRAAERAVLGRASGLVVLSEFSRREIARLHPAAARRAGLIRGGLDVDRFTPASEVTPPVAATPGDPLLVTARRLTPRTGVLELVAAMPAIVDRHPSARLVVLGEGAARPEIETMVSNLALANSVELRGWVDDHELASWYRRADLAVTPTQRLEGFGLATAEALSCGTPVLVTPVGANPEVVDGLGSDYLAAGTTPADLAGAANRALDARLDSRPPTESVRAVVAPRFGWEHVCEQYERQYLNLSGTSNAPSELHPTPNLEKAS
ncbi:MAG TPA: glycosyltransferase family 4 protein [Mycobacteriales bacterium]|nr:glycosyltransferase family 4 protein [Mycobacteriales bacterium]